jgi:hypothetical protein
VLPTSLLQSPLRLQTMISLAANHKQAKRICLALKRTRKMLQSGENGITDFVWMTEQNSLAFIILRFLPPSWWKNIIMNNIVVVHICFSTLNFLKLEWQVNKFVCTGCMWNFQQSTNTRKVEISHSLYSELLGFWTLSISDILETRKHNISETVSISVLRNRWFKLALSKGPNRVGSSPLTWGQEQIQFPKCCVF